MGSRGCGKADHLGHIETRIPPWFTPEELRQAGLFVAMCLAELGYQIDYRVEERRVVFPKAARVVPPEAFCKARRLVCDRMGIPYEVVS